MTSEPKPPLEKAAAMRLMVRRLNYWHDEGWPDAVCLQAARGYYAWLIGNGAWSAAVAEQTLHDLLSKNAQVA